MIMNNSINERIRAVRTSLGKTQEDFAQEIGIGRTSLVNYEKDTVPPLDVIKSIYHKYGVSYDYLIEGKDLDGKDSWIQVAIGNRNRLNQVNQEMDNMSTEYQRLSDQYNRETQLLGKMIEDKEQMIRLLEERIEELKKGG